MQEEAIPQFDTIDRALQTHKRGSRRLSVIIIVLGLIAAAAAFWYSPDQRRKRAARTLRPGADTTAVLRALGPRPTRCPAGEMEQVRADLGVSDADADSAMARLRRDTRQRWLYPGKRGCTPQKGETELGVNAAGRVLWIQPASQQDNVALPTTISH